MALSKSEFDAFNDLDHEGCAIIRDDLDAKLKEYFAEVVASPDNYTIEDQKAAVTELMHAYCQEGTDYAAQIASEYYDAVRADALGTNDDYSATAINDRDPEATEGYLEAEFKKYENNPNVDSLITQLLGRYDYEARKAQGECIYQNGYKDNKRVLYARVTSGTDCKFCVMLASRGFVYSSKRTAGSDGHYHAHCRCRITPGFVDGDGNLLTEVKGYDPDALYREWKAMEAEEQSKS